MQETFEAPTLSLISSSKMRSRKSSLLDCSEDLVRDVPSYQQAEVLDPYRFEDRLTVVLKKTVKRAKTQKRKQS